MPYHDSTYEQTWRDARAARDFVPGEHTPGPWRADQEKGIVWCNGSNGYLVRDYLCEEPNWNPADLRLIAAAPDLLAALKELVSYDEGSSDPEDYGWEVLRRCKESIAKAEGRSDVKD